ncbi:MAG: hypothetical protein ACUVYA_08210 [Planctomycetota bacterium]
MICDAADPLRGCPGLDCHCIPDTIEIVFDATSSNVHEYPPDAAFPIEAISATVYMDVKTAGIWGWAFGVAHDEEVLEVTEATTAGTDARAKFDDSSYERTEYVDVQSCVPNTQCRADHPEERTDGGGWVSHVLSLRSTDLCPSTSGGGSAWRKRHTG